MSRHLK